MIVAFWAAVGKVALKVLQFLVGDKKGRKFLGYVIGIVLFIVLIPVIAIYGLFGWMNAGEVADIVGYDAIYENLPTEVREQIDENEVQLQTIDIAGERKFPPHQIADLRAECINEVKRLNGTLTFEEAVEWQNSYSR